MKTHKNSPVKLTELHLIKKRRMQKTHARKILRIFKSHECDRIFILMVRAFLENHLHGRVRIQLS